MLILGMGGIHDTCYALMEDGKFLAIYEEERFNRIKHNSVGLNFDLGYRSNSALSRMLKECGVKMSDIDYFAEGFSVSHIRGQLPSTLLEHANVYSHHVSSGTENIQSALRSIARPVYHSVMGNKRFASFITSNIRGIDAKKLEFVKHHDAHAASAFFGSNFKRANTIILDAMGEYNATSLYASTEEHPFELLKEFSSATNSIGFVYAAFTFYLGFKKGDEGKTMGLAPYGNPARFRDAFKKVIKLTSDGYVIDPRFYSVEHIEKTFGTKKRRKDELVLNDYYEHVAAALQERLENVYLHLAKLTYEQTGYDSFTLAGGVAMNAKANGKLCADFENCKNIYVCPQAGDNGIAAGAAMYVYWQKTGKRPEPMEHIYWGTEYRDEEIEKVLKKAKAKYTRVENPSADAADMLAKGKILGWFQGRMEVGARALGNRSILADPAVEGMKDTINYFVKGREAWRPFALSMPAEYGKEYLEHNMDSPFMILIDDVKEEWRKALSAGVHVDQTTRPQTLERRLNPKYYDLMKEFGKQTGHYSVLNTSFNLAGEPIVEHPMHALSDFATSGMDALFLGNFKLEK
ncbi:MAG: carbamoyltransferase C-terminal domain-containing protein [Candidatus Micrarchaeota archaeon]